MATTNSVITVKAKNKMAKARAGIAPLPKIVGMAFGSGGVNESGVPIMPVESGLQNELLRKEIDGFTAVSEICYRYSATIGKSELVGSSINEIGLYDADGDMVALKTFTSKPKDDDMEMIFEMDDQF